MSQSFVRYEHAAAFARAYARHLNHTAGIEKGKEYNRSVFLVHLLPKPNNRFGFELRCEVVEPTDPFSLKDIATLREIATEAMQTSTVRETVKRTLDMLRAKGLIENDDARA